MEEENNNTGNSHILCHILFLTWALFFAAKITGHVDWSWWVVFIPLYPFIGIIGLALGLVCMGMLIIFLICILYVIYVLITGKKYEKTGEDL